MTRAAVCAVAFLLFPAIPAAAQSAGAGPRPTALADSLFRSGDAKRAEQAYRDVLVKDANDSRAVYQLAVLSTDRDESLRLFRRYATLEPDDAWGAIALANALARQGRTREALEWYDRAARMNAAAAGEAREGAMKLRTAAAPEVTSGASTSRDSDGNLGRGVSFAVDLPVGATARIGIRTAASDVRDGVDLLGASEVALQASARPSATARLEGSIGAVRLPTLARTGHEWILPAGRARFRWSAPGKRGVIVDASARRELVRASPLLLAGRVVREEGRGLLEVPLVGPLRLRGVARVASLVSRYNRNLRTEFATATVVRVAPSVELSLQGGVWGFQHPSIDGYFAPRSVQTVQAGSYFELAPSSRWTVAGDFSAGVQRFAPYAVTTGGPGSSGSAGTGAGAGGGSAASPYHAWRQTLGGYGLIGFRPAGPVELRLEVEVYDAAIAPDALSTGGSWRYGSVGISTRWRL